jgi:hypothetical protein
VRAAPAAPVKAICSKRAKLNSQIVAIAEIAILAREYYRRVKTRF